jgi:hypothetical protein
MMKTIRTNLTFTFDDTHISEAGVKDRLDAALMSTFPDAGIDVHTRWVSELSDSPLFGAARHPMNRDEPKGGA